MLLKHKVVPADRREAAGENLHVELSAGEIIDLNRIAVLSLVITLSMVQLP